MACVHFTHEVERHNPARRCFGFLLLLAIAGVLNACGGSAIEPGPGGGGISGGGGGGCVTGSQPTLLTWDAVTGAAGYRIYYGTASGTYPQQVGQGADVGPVTTYQVPGLNSATTYYFAATAYDGSNNESVWSNEVCKTIS